MSPDSDPVRPGRGVCVSGTGMAMPARVLTNDELAKTVDTSDEWITQRTGIKQRRITEKGTAIHELATQAVQQALANAKLTGSDIDLVICATITADMCCPSTAARVAADIGAVPAGAMDLSAACSGFVYGINVASSLIQGGHNRHVVVVGVEQLSQITDWQDRSTCVLFGDGAGAAVLSASDDPQQGCLYQKMASDGEKWHLLYCPRSEADLPADSNGFSGAYNTLQMNGREVYKFAVTKLQQTIDEALDACGVKADDLAMVIAHQSNQRILESARQRLGLDESKFYLNIAQYGNTSAASVPICLHEIHEAGKIKRGDLVLFVGIGGGLTWAASLWRWERPRIERDNNERIGRQPVDRAVPRSRRPGSGHGQGLGRQQPGRQTHFRTGR